MSDLTLDCNYTGGAYTYHGLGLVGTSNTVRRVKVIHMARASLANSESWGIIITASPVPDSEGNVIEDCEVSQFAGGSGCSAVSFNGGVTNAISGIIRNNRIRLAPTNGAAINGSWTHDCLIEGNYIDGAQDGIYGDTGTSTDITVIRNTLRNCTHAISYHTAFRQNITIASNTIEIASRPVQVYPTAFYFNPNASYKNIIIRGNHVRNHGAPEATPRFLNACNISGLVVAGNTVDRSFTNILSGCKGVAMYDNFDLTGKLLTNIHQRASPNAASGTVVSNRVIYDGAVHR